MKVVSIFVSFHVIKVVICSNGFIMNELDAVLRSSRKQHVPIAEQENSGSMGVEENSREEAEAFRSEQIVCEIQKQRDESDFQDTQIDKQRNDDFSDDTCFDSNLAAEKTGYYTRKDSKSRIGCKFEILKTNFVKETDLDDLLTDTVRINDDEFPRNEDLINKTAPNGINDANFGSKESLNSESYDTLKDSLGITDDRKEYRLTSNGKEDVSEHKELIDVQHTEVDENKPNNIIGKEENAIPQVFFGKDAGSSDISSVVLQLRFSFVPYS